MSKDDRHADFEINFIENDQLKITTDDCSIVTEYIEDRDVKRTTFGSGQYVFFSLRIVSLDGYSGILPETQHPDRWV